MLVQLCVNDFAIAERIELALGPGMTALTGETGAGKSILVDALDLALGARARADDVRPGAERADVTAVFELDAGAPALAWLREHELDDGPGECILRRTVGRDGRSRAFVNGRPQPVQALRELGERLVDIYGQHAHQSLLRRDAQRDILDGFAGNAGRLRRLAGACARWRDAETRLEREGERLGDRDARLDYLRFQAHELAALELAAGEPERLDEEQRRLANADELAGTFARVAARLEGGEAGDDAGGVVDAVRAAERALAAAERFEPRAAEARALLDSAAIELDEAAASVRALGDAVESDPERLAAVESRLAGVHDLARKHRVEPAALPAHLEALEREIAGLEAVETRLAEIERERDAALDEYRRVGDEVHRARAEASASLAAEVTANMAPLGMDDARFEIGLESEPDARPSPAGWDRVEFAVAANPGQPPRALARVASGGELSRISLAIHVCGVQASAAPTLVFDEVDVGVGGRVAERVGRALADLGARRQVLCVTHLPQVAACATHHLRVDKATRGNETRAAVEPLDAEARVREIARMLGGERITERTLAHAREMLGE